MGAHRGLPSASVRLPLLVRLCIDNRQAGQPIAKPDTSRGDDRGTLGPVLDTGHPWIPGLAALAPSGQKKAVHQKHGLGTFIPFLLLFLMKT